MTKDILLYGSVATGFRSPGFNPRISTVGQLTGFRGRKHPVRVRQQGRLPRSPPAGQHGDLLHRLSEAPESVAQGAVQRCQRSGPGYSEQFPHAVPGRYSAGGNVRYRSVVLLHGGAGIIRGAELQLTANPIDRLDINYSVGFNQFRSGLPTRSTRRTSIHQ